MSATPSMECDVRTSMPSPSSTRATTFSSSQLDTLRARVKGRVFVPGDDGCGTRRRPRTSAPRERGAARELRQHDARADRARLGISGFVGAIACGRHGAGGSQREVARRRRRRASARPRAAQRLCRHGRGLRLLRGGGGNFAIVPSFSFDLYPVKQIFGGFVAYPLAQGRQALSAYAQWTRTVPDTLTSAMRLVHYPPAPAIPEPLRGASAVVIMACYNGSTAEGEALLQPLRSIGTPLLDTFRPMPYAEIATIANDPPEAPPLFTFANGGGLRDLSADVIEALLRIAGDQASGIFVVEA